MKLFRTILAVMLIVTLTTGLIAGCSDKDETTQTSQTEAGESETDQTDGIEQGTEIYDYSSLLDERGFWKDVTALDYVTLFDYKNIEVAEAVHSIPDEVIQEQIDGLLNSYLENEIIEDRAVVDGDTVNIDYVGSVDGVDFEGGSTQGTGTEVTIGVTAYIDDFLEQLIGHEPGETFDIKVTFPEDYGVENLNGKDAVFVTTINHIVESKLPELNDKFVVDNFSAEQGWNTVAELNDGIRTGMQESAVSLFLQDHIAENSTVSSIPESMIEFQEQTMLDYYAGYAASYGITLDEFATTYLEVADTDELLEQNREQNENMAKFYLIVQAIAEDAEIALSDEEVKEHFAAEYSEQDYDALLTSAGMPYMKMIVINQKVLEFLQDNVKLA